MDFAAATDRRQHSRVIAKLHQVHRRNGFQGSVDQSRRVVRRVIEDDSVVVVRHAGWEVRLHLPFRNEERKDAHERSARPQRDQQRRPGLQATSHVPGVRAEGAMAARRFEERAPLRSKRCDPAAVRQDIGPPFRGGDGVHSLRPSTQAIHEAGPSRCASRWCIPTAFHPAPLAVSTGLSSISRSR